MSFIKCLPSHVAQHMFSFDNVYMKIYHAIIIQLIHYHLLNSNSISNLNKYKLTQYSLNKKWKITYGIKTFITQTNNEFDMNKITLFTKELPNVYTVSHGERKRMFRGYYIFLFYNDYCEYLSFKKYSCCNHFAEFGPSKCGYDHLMALFHIKLK